MENLGLIGICPNTKIVDTIAAFEPEHIKNIAENGLVCVILPKEQIRELWTRQIDFNDLVFKE